MVGVGLLAYSIHRTGASTVWAVARTALPFLPAIAFFNAVFYLTEGLGQKQMLGEAGTTIPFRIFIRATMAAFVAGALLPLGRAGAEVLRTTSFAPYVGLARASAASTTFQAPALFGNASLALVCSLTASLTLGFSHPLSWVLFLHGTLSVGAGLALAAVATNLGLGRRLTQLFPRLETIAGGFDEAAAQPVGRYLRATGLCMAARISELAQYTLILIALGLEPNVPRVLLTNGIHIIGATAGEAIPNQLGTVESAYLYFASAIGLEGKQAQAISIALLVRIAQYLIAALSLIWLRATDTPSDPRVVSTDD